MLLSFFRKRKRALLYQYLAALQPYIDGVNRLATSAYKPPRLGKSLLLGLSRRVGQSYPLVADQVDLQPYFTYASR